MDIKDKTFAITGAASGLGSATAAYLISKGARVIAIDIRSREELPEFLSGSEVHYYQADVKSSEQLNLALAQGVNQFGCVHGAISCAGIAPAAAVHSSRKGSHSPEDFIKTLEINLAGTFYLFNNIVPYLKENNPEDPDGERGILIATSSIAAYEGQIGQTAYASSKGGIAAMILPMARELARSGIRVNAIAPGIFQTPMVAAFPTEVQESLAAEVPFPARLGKPEEFAALAGHLITNSYINGTVIRLDGGVRMR